MPAINGKLLQLQHFSVNDGDGIRTIIFFAGCSLRCKWCANPEGYTMHNQIMYIESLCTACGRCTAVCPRHLDFDLHNKAVRSQCDGCGCCIPACLDNARKNTVSIWTSEDVIAQLEPQIPYFRQSGGGVTYSGGECTNQPEFLEELVKKVYDLGLNQAMETSATFDFDQVQSILKHIDVLFVDIKHMDSKKHAYYTGCDNEHILSTIARLGRFRNDLVIRIPVIMGVNGDDANIISTARFVKQYIWDPKIELLPYHSYGADKYKQLDMSYPKNMFRTPTAAELNHMNSLIEKEGVQIISFK